MELKEVLFGAAVVLASAGSVVDVIGGTYYDLREGDVIQENKRTIENYAVNLEGFEKPSFLV